MSRRIIDRRGLTLVELVVVLTILVALAGMVVPMLSRAASEAQHDATRASLATLRELIVNQYQVDTGQLPRSPVGGQPQLRYLFVDPWANTAAAGWNPTARTGWRGPYLISAAAYPAPSALDGWDLPAAARGFDLRFGAAGDATPIDAWGNPIVLQQPDAAGTFARLVSAGPNGVLDTPLDATHVTPADLAAHPSDDLVAYLYMPDLP